MNGLRRDRCEKSARNQRIDVQEPRTEVAGTLIAIRSRHEAIKRDTRERKRIAMALTIIVVGGTSSRSAVIVLTRKNSTARIHA